ncbi:MAG: site-specific integrase [Vagococcus sp.]|uniref:site-specific integrase n=1 Tax=Vagococcus sp. TaxID=1933889 RepID=UPI002FCC85C2
MAYIKSYQLKNGTIKWEYFVSKGRSKNNGTPLKIHKRGFLSKRDAEKAAKIIEGQIASGAYFADNPQKMTIERYLDEWINKHKKNVKEGTIIVYKDSIRMYVIPYIGNIQISKYTRAMHQDYIDQLFTDPSLGRNKNGLSWNTVKTVNGALFTAFKKAISLGYIHDNPCAYVEFPDDKRNRKKEPNFYTLEQSNKFLEFASKQREPFWYVFFLFIFDLGLRKGEVMALRWSEIDITAKEVQVTYTRLYRKETKGEIYLDYTKTEAGIRKLLLTNRLQKALINLFNSFYGTNNLIPFTKNNDDFIFTYQTGTTRGYPVRSRSVNGASDRIMKQAKLPKIKVHDGRHTNAVRLRQAGVPLEDIKDLLGHKDIEMTQMYAHVSPEIKERSMEKLELILNDKKA